MLHKRHNSVVTLFILLAFVGVSKPARALILSQSDPANATFSIPEQLPQDAKIKIAADNSTSSINESLKNGFVTKYPDAQVNVETQDSNAALQSLSAGEADLVAIGRALTPQEKAQGLIAVPISREKIAIVVSNNNPYDGNLTIDQFAQIFRGEITDWSEIGGNPGEIKLVDLPDNNDTRQAFSNYPVFQAAVFSTGANATKLEQDSTDAMIEELGANGISYAVANDVIGRDDVKIVTMHQTQPDDMRYPFSQPFNLVYQGTPSAATQAYLGYATNEGGQEVVASRIGSLATVGAIATGLTQDLTPTQLVQNTTADIDNPDLDSTNPTANENLESDSGTIADANSNSATVDDSGSVLDQDSGEINPNLDGSGEIDPNLNGSGEIDPNLDGSGEIDSNLDGSGEINPNLNGSGEIDSNLDGSGELLSSENQQLNGAADPESAIADSTIPNVADSEISEPDTTEESSRWWLWLLPLLGIGLLAAMFALGGRKKSDQEPAIDNIANPNAPNGGIGNAQRPDGDIPPVGANVSGLGNVTSNAAGTTSRLGNTAVAGGGAIAGSAIAANLATDNKRAEDSDIDLVDEIPSNPVSEFGDREQELLISDQPTQLPTDNRTDLESTNDLPTTGVAGFGTGATAASGLTDNRADSMAEDLGTTDSTTLDFDRSAQPQTNQTSNFPDRGTENTTSENIVELEQSNATEENTEFTGDFVLLEETKGRLASGDDPALKLDSTLAQEQISSTVDEPSEEIATEKLDLAENPDIDTEPSPVQDNLEVVESDVDLDFSSTSEATETTTSELETPELDLAEDSNSSTNIIDGAIATGSTAMVGGAAVSGLIDSDRTGDPEPHRFTEESLPSLEGLPSAERNLDSAESTELNPEQGRLDTDEFDSDLDLDSSSTTEPEVSELNFAEESNSDTNVIDGATSIGGAAAFGGMAAAASGFVNRDGDRVPELDLDKDFDFLSEPSTLEANAGLEEITFDDVDNSVDASLEEITFDDVDNSVDAGLEEITFDDVDNSVDASLEEITFDDIDNSVDAGLEEITFDDIDNSVDADLEEITSDRDVILDDLEFNELDDDSSSQLLSNSTANITGLEDDRSNDMNNITQWLDSLETPTPNTDNISEWLESLDTDDNDSAKHDDQDVNLNLEQEADDISFKFLEDLLERDSNNQDK